MVVDQFQHLPDECTLLILELLPYDEIVRTSILAKSWSQKWRYTRELILDDQFHKKIDMGTKGFISIISKILEKHLGSIITFELQIPSSVDADCSKYLNGWIKLLANKGVKSLTIQNESGTYLPNLETFLFTDTKLEVLELRSCIVSPPSHCEVYENLFCLMFSAIDLAATNQELHLPKLNTFGMIQCLNVSRFKVTAPKLKMLILSYTRGLCYPHFLNNPEIEFLNLSSDSMEQYNGKPFCLESLLQHLRCLKALISNGNFIKEYVAIVPKDVAELGVKFKVPLSFLTNLNLRIFDCGDVKSLSCLFQLLNNAPNLTSLFLELKVIPNRAKDGIKGRQYTNSVKCCHASKLSFLKFSHYKATKPIKRFTKKLLQLCLDLKTLQINVDSLEEKVLVMNTVDALSVSPGTKVHVIVKN